jgi:hypothetical protein
MNILGVRKTKILIFKSARSLLSTFFVRAARAILCENSVNYDSEDRRMFYDFSQISTILEHGFNVRAS